MKLILQFDIKREAIYLPDGFVYDIKSLQCDFFEWAEEQSDTYVKGPGRMVSRHYSCNSFLRYINECVLADVTEKAYQISVPIHSDKSTCILFF